MRLPAVKAIVLIASFPISASCALAAQNQPDAQGAQPFALSARLNQLPQLSRSEIDSNATTSIAPARGNSPAISYAPGLPIGVGVAPHAAAPLSARIEQTTQDDRPGAFLTERNVDWSKWVSKFADRWFYVLRLYEDGAHAEFLTQRAALIEFTCYANGQLGNIRLKQSSGNLIYDRLQVIALMQTVPLLPFPPGTKRTSITLLQGWESHVQKPGESTYVPGSFGKNFPTEKVREWVMER